jgi:hypothetical protein
MDPHYTVTVYVAAPGTPLTIGEEGVTSLPGHMFFTTSDGHASPKSYGFAPIKHGSVDGPGYIPHEDVKDYKDPLYSRTMEISKEQYDKLNAFGSSPETYGFDLHYKDVRNNCVDFTWGALNHAGLHARTLLGGKAVELPGFEGDLRPTRNINEIRSIADPIPDSPLNTEHSNPMPSRSVLQRLLSEDEHRQAPGQRIDKNSSVDDMFDALYHASIHKDDAAARDIGRAYAQSASGQDFFAQGQLFNQEMRAQEQQAALEARQLALQAPMQRGPVMTH